MDTTPRKILRLPQVLDITGLSKWTIYDRVKRGTFPRQVKLGKWAVGWYEDEVAEYQAGLRRAGDEKAA
jgi:prophage regulatory protein